jgi:CRISPR/Cas system-associated exonuclease Cas4 (RecB family)
MKTLLYDGTVEIEFDERRHVYTSGGVLIPGVTSILSRLSKEALIQWAANSAVDYVRANLTPDCDRELVFKDAKTAHRRLARAAADIGTEVHKYAECVLKKEPAVMPEGPAAKGCEAFLAWLDAHNVETLASERVIFSKADWYAGTCDFYGLVDGVLTVGDIKTSSGLYPEMLLQTAAYIRAIEEEIGSRVAQRIIIRVDKKTGAFHPYVFPYSERDVQTFRMLREVHRGMTALEEEMEARKVAA